MRYLYAISACSTCRQAVNTLGTLALVLTCTRSSERPQFLKLWAVPLTCAIIVRLCALLRSGSSWTGRPLYLGGAKLSHVARVSPVVNPYN